MGGGEGKRKWGMGEGRGGGGGREWEGREGRSWRHGFLGGGEISPPWSFLKVGAYAPHSQQSSSDKCNGEVGIS